MINKLDWNLIWTKIMAVWDKSFYRRIVEGMDWITICCEIAQERILIEFTELCKWKSVTVSWALFKQVSCGKVNLLTWLQGPCTSAPWNVCTVPKTGPIQIYFRKKFWLDNNILVTFKNEWPLSVIKCKLLVNLHFCSFEQFLVLSRHLIVNRQMHNCGQFFYCTEFRECSWLLINDYWTTKESGKGK